jgi:hypothetical protein
MFGDPNRIMYTFKAKSKETDTLKGSKVYLALPLDTVSDISTLWTEHSIGAIYTPIFKEQIRASVNEMIGSASQTEEQKYYMMYWVLGSSDLGITPITVTSMVQRTIPAPNTFTQEEYDAVYNWYSVYQNPNVDLTKSPMDSLTNFNLFYQSFADAATKQWLVDIVTLAKYAKTAIDARGTSDFVVSSPEFDTFLATNTDPNAKAIRDMTKEISYITNPAFFKEGGILLGTFNLATNGFNKITDGIWSEIGSGTDTALDTLNAFNLDEINPYVPSQVVTMDVTIE